MNGDDTVPNPAQRHSVQPASRAERRARTRDAILDAARVTFADHGYQKATIRAVALRAGCDPALIMQHFGNKQALFRAATAMDLELAEVLDGPARTRSVRVLRRTFERLDAHPEAAASTLRSMLTHDESADEALKLFNPPELGDVAPEPAEHGELRRQLVVSLVLGTAITRYVLTDPAVQNASIEDLVDCLDLAVRQLVPQPPD